MKIRIIENSRIPKLLSWFINISAITLYPFIISRGKMNQRTLTHEMIHIKQQRELWVIGFYILYVWYWLKNIIWRGMYPANAYRAIPFEVEAYENDHNDLYPLTRERMAWRNYHSDGVIEIEVKIDINDLKRDD